MRKTLGILFLVAVLSTGVLCISWDINWGMSEDTIRTIEKGAFNKESYLYQAYPMDHSIREEIKSISFTESVDFLKIERVYSFWKDKLFSVKIIYDCSELGSIKTEFHYRLFFLGELYRKTTLHLPKIPNFPPDRSTTPDRLTINRMEFQMSCLRAYILDIPATLEIYDEQITSEIRNTLKNRYDTKE